MFKKDEIATAWKRFITGLKKAGVFIRRRWKRILAGRGSTGIVQGLVQRRKITQRTTTAVTA